jgi:hypothetical protein
MTGVICRADTSGLGHQTRALARLIRPDKIMVVDSRPFRGQSTAQHLEWYEGYSGGIVNGFPSEEQVGIWIRGLHQVLTCETTYCPDFYKLARARNVHVINQINPEFFDGWINHGLVPDTILLPSRWMEDAIRRSFRAAMCATCRRPCLLRTFRKCGRQICAAEVYGGSSIQLADSRPTIARGRSTY